VGLCGWVACEEEVGGWGESKSLRGSWRGFHAQFVVLVLVLVVVVVEKEVDGSSRTRKMRPVAGSRSILARVGMRAVGSLEVVASWLGEELRKGRRRRELGYVVCGGVRAVLEEEGIFSTPPEGVLSLLVRPRRR